MAKFLLIVALLVAVSAAFSIYGGSTEFSLNTRLRTDEVCRPAVCVKEGADCDVVVFNNVSASTKERYCEADDYCKYNVTNGDLTGKCTEGFEVGQACTNDLDCEGELGCVNKFCNKGYFPGAKCKVPNDCLYYAENGDATAVCNNGRCAGIALGAKCSRPNLRQTCSPPNVCGPDGTCIAPLPVGAKCGGNPDCQFSLYCSNMTCAARIANGQACTLGASSEQCVYGLTCLPNGQTGDDATKGTCKNFFLGAAGALCVTPTDCNEGLTCLAKASGSSNAYGACGPTIASSRKSCNASDAADNTNVCSANEQCVCNVNTGAGSCYTNNIAVVNKGSKGRWNSLVDCGSKCARTDYSCQEKCGGKYCSYISKLPKVNDNFGSTELKCASDDSAWVLAGYIHCSSGSFIQFSFVGLVAVIAALLL